MIGSRVGITVVSPEKPLCEDVKVKAKLQCGAQMVEVPELWVITGGKLQAKTELETWDPQSPLRPICFHYELQMPDM